MESKEITNWRDDQALRRLEMITPLLDPDMDEAKRAQMRETIAEKNNLSVRSLYRYEKYYRENSFNGLRPANRQKRRSARLPDNYDEIVGQAIQLKKEVPRRSIRQIIKILESEGWAPPGILKASTLQRYLFNAGLGKKQMRKYTEARETSSRRFCRPHRLELIPGDIKYGPQIRDKDGKLVKTFDPHDTGWLHCNAMIILNEERPGKHRIEIRMHEGDENRNLTILCFGIVR